MGPTIHHSTDCGCSQCIGCDSCNTLRTQLAACRAALRKYGQHTDDRCGHQIVRREHVLDGQVYTISINDGPYECFCGLDAALAGGE